MNTKTRTPSMRLDYLSSQEERKLVYGGTCQKIIALICSILGIVTLVASFLLLRNDQLQIQNYINVITYDDGATNFYRPFPAVLLGCAAATTASSIVQVIGSLMFLFEDITLGVWKWLKFTVLMISSISVMLLMAEGYSDVHLYGFYFTFLVINSILCTLFLTGDVFCSRCTNQSTVVRSY